MLRYFSDSFYFYQRTFFFNFRFHVDHDVKLNAVSLYGAKNPHFAEYRSSIEVVDRNTKELLGKVKYLNLTSSDEKYKVSFKQPISLTAFKKYSIRVKIEVKFFFGL